MGEKINNILKGEIISSVFYILLGLCLILIPTQTVDVICKVVFGLILIGAGIYHIYIYIRGKAKATIMDLLSGGKAGTGGKCLTSVTDTACFPTRR